MSFSTESVKKQGGNIATAFLCAVIIGAGAISVSSASNTQDSPTTSTTTVLDIPTSETQTFKVGGGSVGSGGSLGNGSLSTPRR